MNTRILAVVISHSGVLLSKKNGRYYMPSFLKANKHSYQHTPEDAVRTETGLIVRGLCPIGEQMYRLDGMDVGHLCLQTGGEFHKGMHQDHAFLGIKALKRRKAANSLFCDLSTERLAWDALSILASPKILTEVNLEQVVNISATPGSTEITALNSAGEVLATWRRFNPFTEGILD